MGLEALASRLVLGLVKHSGLHGVLTLLQTDTHKQAQAEKSQGGKWLIFP
jgi:hypothetical protein